MSAGRPVSELNKMYTKYEPFFFFVIVVLQSLRASSSVSPTRSSRLRASHWVNASSSKGPWVPPPGKATKTRMSWEVHKYFYKAFWASLNCIFNDQGPTHRLEINPVGVDPSGSTVLRVSDLNSEEGSTDVIVEQESSNYTKKLNSLHAEVEHLKTEVNPLIIFPPHNKLLMIEKVH